MDSKTKSYKKLYEKLQSSTIMSEIFKIGSVDEIGTIGGYRLGKIQRVDVPWEEINAAIG